MTDSPAENWASFFAWDRQEDHLWRVWPFGMGRALLLATMREVLVISPNPSMLLQLKSILEVGGYRVSQARRLEDPFFEAIRSTPFVVLVDHEAVFEGSEYLPELLRWFHYRSPLILLNGGKPHETSPYWDQILSRSADRQELLQCIRKFER